MHGEKVVTRKADISPLDSEHQHILENGTAAGSTTTAATNPNFDQHLQLSGEARHGTTADLKPLLHAHSEGQKQPRAEPNNMTESRNPTRDDFLERDNRAYEQHREQIFVEQMKLEEQQREFEFKDRKKRLELEGQRQHLEFENRQQQLQLEKQQQLCVCTSDVYVCHKGEPVILKSTLKWTCLAHRELGEHSQQRFS